LDIDLKKLKTNGTIILRNTSHERITITVIPNIEETREKNGKYVTVKLTPREEIGVDNQTFSLFKDGVIHISCVDYEIIGAESSSWWYKAFELIFEGTLLSVAHAEDIENIRFCFPKPVEE
jgi:hypothetical protein